MTGIVRDHGRVPEPLRLHFPAWFFRREICWVGPRGDTNKELLLIGILHLFFEAVFFALNEIIDVRHRDAHSGRTHP